MKAKILAYALLALILTTIHLADAQQPQKVARIGYLTTQPTALDSDRSRSFVGHCMSSVTSKDRTFRWSTEVGKASLIGLLG